MGTGTFQQHRSFLSKDMAIQIAVSRSVSGELLLLAWSAKISAGEPTSALPSMKIVVAWGIPVKRRNNTRFLLDFGKSGFAEPAETEEVALDLSSVASPCFWDTRQLCELSRPPSQRRRRWTGSSVGATKMLRSVRKDYPQRYITHHSRLTRVWAMWYCVTNRETFLRHGLKRWHDRRGGKSGE